MSGTLKDHMNRGTVIETIPIGPYINEIVHDPVCNCTLIFCNPLKGNWALFGAEIEGPATPAVIAALKSECSKWYQARGEL